MTKKREKKNEGMKAKDFPGFFIQLYPPEYKNIPAFMLDAEKEHGRRLPPGKNVSQSWRNVKGLGLERVIEHILARQLEPLNLDLISVDEARERVEIDFGEYGSHLPDVDLVVYQPSRNRILAILSIKSSLRERATQTAYWRLKLHAQSNTKNIRVFLLTPNSDDDLRSRRKPKKNRAVLETDIDAIYVVNRPEFELANYLYPGVESRIRMIDELADDLAELADRKYL